MFPYCIHLKTPTSPTYVYYSEVYKSFDFTINPQSAQIRERGGEGVGWEDGGLYKLGIYSA